jgi:hypothetical protein
MNTKRPAYKQHEAWMIQLLKRLFEKAKLKVDDRPKVGKLPLEIDLVVIAGKKEPTTSLLKLPQLFNYFQRYNIVEVKVRKTVLKLRMSRNCKHTAGSIWRNRR